MQKSAVVKRRLLDDATAATEQKHQSGDEALMELEHYATHVACTTQN